MPKKKTRKQKVVADTRHREYFAEPLEQVQTETRNNVQNVQLEDNERPKPRVIATANYSYLYSDLLKTLMLTISVIAVELVLRYFVFGA
jgi:hypothetical protein